MGIIRKIDPGAFTGNDFSKPAVKISKQEKSYYMLQRNGDTLSSSSSEGIKVVKKERCFNCDLKPTDIIECNTKHGIFRWTGDEWVTYIVKGKLNVYYTLDKYGSYTKHNYGSGGNMSVTQGNNAGGIYKIYFERSRSMGVVDIKFPDPIRLAFADNKTCLDKFNKLIDSNQIIKPSQFRKVIEIIELYNKSRG